ncbi:MAG: GAF domain-containing protein [Magnetococcales bacterium]|nr:GAF domain-containing protein [Magnetococcales bacterium]
MDNREIQAGIQQLERLISTGLALSAEKDITRLMETILLEAKNLTHADGGTLYTMSDDGSCLHFATIHNDSLNIAMGGTTGVPILFQPIPLRLEDGTANDHMVVVRAVLEGRAFNIPDAYHVEGFDFSGTRAFDERTGYRSQSFLTVPMKNHEDKIIGVLQLINAQDPQTHEVIAFSPSIQRLVEALSSQAAIAMTNKMLLDGQRKLFEAFIELIASAIDDKSPYTGGHCRRVPELTMRLAEAAHRTREGPFQGFQMTGDDRYELRIAAWLHDCGKVVTPVHVVDKSVKLETIYDRIETVSARMEVIRRDLEIRYLKEEMAAMKAGRAPEIDLEQRAAEINKLNDDMNFLRRINTGGEFMPQEQQQRVCEIARQCFLDGQGNRVPLLSEDEVKNLTISRGTLTDKEREVINYHIVATIKMLESLPFPSYLKNVPEFAGGHHERMDGRGYPKGLRREQMSVQARMMGIADIFEALTARDRPYKKGKTLSETLKIMEQMKKDQHIDPDLFDLFIREKVYLDYANIYLEPEQIDEVDESRLLGYRSLADAA